MKNLIYFIAILLFISCSKNPDKVLPRKEGKWKYSQFNRTGIFTFNKDGSGNNYEDQTNTNTKIYWDYNETEDKLLIYFTNHINRTLIYESKEKKRKSEIWFTEGDGINTTNITLEKIK